MRKILFVLMVLVTSAAFGQGVRLKTNIAGFGGAHFAGVPPGYTKLNVRYEFVAMAIDSGLHIPQYNGTPSGVRTGVWGASGAIGMDTLNHRFYTYSGGAWVRVANYADIAASTPTWQQTLTAGSTLTGNNTIAGDGYDFTWNNMGNVTYNMEEIRDFVVSIPSSGNLSEFRAQNGAITGYTDNVALGTTAVFESGTDLVQNYVTKSGDYSTLITRYDNTHLEAGGLIHPASSINYGFVVENLSKSIKIGKAIAINSNNFRGLRVDSLWQVYLDSINAGSATDSILVINQSTGQVGYRNASGLSAGSVPISGLTAATGTNTINNAAYQQEWQWNSLADGTGLLLSSSSTAAASNTQNLFGVQLTGANATSTQMTTAISGGNFHTGTSSTNVAVYGISNNGTTNIGGRFTAAGGTNNYAIKTEDGDVMLNQQNGFTQFGAAGTNSGVIKTSGSSSGTITIQPAAAAGTYTLTLPTNDGDASQFLQTNGSGVLSFATVSGTLPSTGNQGEILQVSNGAAAWKYDTTTLVTFTAGANFAADTAAFTDSTIYGSFKLMGNDTFYVTGVSAVLYSNNAITDTLGIQITYNDTINVIGSHVFAATYGINNETTGQDADADSFTGSNPVPIPPGNWVWLKSPTVVAGRKPYHLSVSIIGYKKRVN